MSEDDFCLKELMYTAAVEAVTLFAVWRDGVQWVNDMRTLKEAIRILYKEFYGNYPEDTKTKP